MTFNHGVPSSSLGWVTNKKSAIRRVATADANSFGRPWGGYKTPEFS